MKPGITAGNAPAVPGRRSRPLEFRQPADCLVLGAGNVSSIPTTDAFTKLFQEGRTVLLKMNPVNESLGPIFERAYAPLIDAGYLQIIYGGPEVGAAAVEHELVGEVHITGSINSHDAIVWGPAGPERDRRKRDNDPVLKNRSPANWATSLRGSSSPANIRKSSSIFRPRTWPRRSPTTVRSTASPPR